jgi:hypothetical protein
MLLPSLGLGWLPARDVSQGNAMSLVSLDSFPQSLLRAVHATAARLALAAILSGSISSLPAARHNEGPPIAPRETIVLFDGKTVNDLSRFYTWLADHGYDDPNRVFTVVDQIDGAPAIRISGLDWGGIVTYDQYSRYKLVVEYRWGNVTWGSRKDRARNSGILLHCQGPDGNRTANMRGPWIVSVEYEILEGRTGDVILVSGYDASGKERILPRAMMRAKPGDSYWDPEGEPREFVAGKGHLHWFGRDRQWKDVLGFRGPQDVEKPVGEWNLVEVNVDGDHFIHFLNGVKVLELTQASLDHGRLLFQSEGAEIFYRRIELQPLDRR